MATDRHTGTTKPRQTVTGSDYRKGWDNKINVKCSVHTPGAGRVRVTVVGHASTCIVQHYIQLLGHWSYMWFLEGSVLISFRGCHKLARMVYASRVVRLYCKHMSKQTQQLISHKKVTNIQASEGPLRCAVNSLIFLYHCLLLLSCSYINPLPMMHRSLHKAIGIY